MNRPSRIQATAGENQGLQDPARSDPDTDIIARAHGGDVRGALQLLMQRHGVAVFRYCRHMLRDVALAEDIHQKVFIEAFRDLGTFAGRSRLRSWLFAIAYHRVLDAMTARKRAQARNCNVESREPVEPQLPADERLDNARLGAALVAAIEELPEPSRTAVLLRFQGMSFEDMARLCAEKPGTLQMRVARALRVLRASILLRTGGKLC